MKLTANVRYDSDWQEYTVSLRKGRDTISTYHTDDKTDAYQTAVNMLKAGIQAQQTTRMM
jgi:hypothetical protein